MANYNHNLVSMPFTICCCCCLYLCSSFLMQRGLHFNGTFFHFKWCYCFSSLCCQLFWECIVAEIKIKSVMCSSAIIDAATTVQLCQLQEFMKERKNRDFCFDQY